MENINAKADFLRTEYTRILTRIAPDAPCLWGKMNVQQMIEHMCEYVAIASGKIETKTITSDENLPRMQSFLASEKPFKENTPNSLMPDEPSAVKHVSIDNAIRELQQEIDNFFAVYAIDPNKQTPNPFFGSLGFEQQVQLLHKHALHHLRQFGINP